MPVPKLIKILSGDVSDNIKGIRGVKEKTLIKYFPEITEKTLTLEYIMSKIEILQNERKTRLKTLDNILNRVTVGCQGEDIFEINEKIICDLDVDMERKGVFIDKKLKNCKIFFDFLF